MGLLWDLVFWCSLDAKGTRGEPFKGMAVLPHFEGMNATAVTVKVT